MNTDDALASIKMNSAERVAALQRQASQVNLAGKDRDTAFLVELVPSLFGVFGIGYLYAGMTAAGVARIAVSILVWVLYGIFGAVTLGLGYCAGPLFWIAIVALAYFSAKELKELLPAKGAAMGGPSGYIEPGRQDQPPYTTQTPPYEQQGYTPPADQAPWQQGQQSGNLGYPPPNQASDTPGDSNRDDTL